MVTLFEKPIETATVYFAGEKAAGIHSATFSVEVWIDPVQFDDNTEAKEFIDDIREGLRRTFETMLGYTPIVLFDFESEA